MWLWVIYRQVGSHEGGTREKRERLLVDEQRAASGPKFTDQRGYNRNIPLGNQIWHLFNLVQSVAGSASSAAYISLKIMRQLLRAKEGEQIHAL